MPLIPIVDKDDVIITYKERRSLDRDDISRVSALWLTNSHGDILISQRHRSKKHNPLKWGTAVSGTVEIDETYEQNLIKEVEEEIGIRNITIKLSHKTKPESGFQYFIQYFTSVLDIPIEGFELQESEVENIRWVSPNDLQEAVNNNPEHFVPYFQKIALLFISENSFQT